MTPNTDPTALARRATDAGASGALVAVVITDHPDGGQHQPRRTLARHAATGGMPGPLGGFLTALWDGDLERAWRRADGSNRALMRAAGVAKDVPLPAETPTA